MHGDLSAKNVLWSLQPAPAVYVLDCDGAVIGGAARVRPHLPRATTPNWEDPALSPGQPPGEAADRYVLGLAFLRLVGAAHFPLQGRQRAHPRVNVDLELPRSWRKFPDMPGLWEMCERSLSLVNAAERPAPAEWAAALEDLLDVLGAAGTAPGPGRPRATNGPPGMVAWPARCRPRLAGADGGDVHDVVVRPVLRHRAVATWQLIRPAPGMSGPGARVALGSRPG